MIPMQEILLASAAVLLLTLAVLSSLRKNREFKRKEDTRRLDSVLQGRESVKGICPQKKGCVILTSRRLLFETREGFHAVLLKDIKRVRGNTRDKKTTTSIPKMVSLTVKAEQEYVIKNDCEEFEAFAKQLMKKTKKRRADQAGRKR